MIVLLDLSDFPGSRVLLSIPHTVIIAITLVKSLNMFIVCSAWQQECHMLLDCFGEIFEMN